MRPSAQHPSRADRAAKRLRVRLRADLRLVRREKSADSIRVHPWLKNPTARAVRDNRALPSNGRVLADAATDGFAHEDASGIFALLSFFAAKHLNPARSETGPTLRHRYGLELATFRLELLPDRWRRGVEARADEREVAAEFVELKGKRGGHAELVHLLLHFAELLQ